MTLDELAWPAERLLEALETLAEHAGLRPATVRGAADVGTPAPNGLCDAASAAELTATLDASARAWGLEVESATISYAGLDQFLDSAGPALLRLPPTAHNRGEPAGFLLLLVASGRRVSLLGPNHQLRRLPRHELRERLVAPLESTVERDLERVLVAGNITGARRADARSALAAQWLTAATIEGCWLLRWHPSAPFVQQLRSAACTRRLGQLLASHTVSYLIFLASWWLIGQAALGGRLERGWLLAWALLLLTLIPFRLLATWLQGRLALDAGALLKRRLLLGALRLEPEQVRREGVGHLLGRTVEAETLENLALSGGLQAILAVIELGLAGLVLTLALGPQGAVVLVLWATVATALAWRYATARRLWTVTRMDLTQELVEGMVGHRTRIAQQPREAWHTTEDAALEGYLRLSRVLDRRGAALTALVPRGWLVLGLAALAPGFLATTTTTPLFAVGIGGVLLAFRAFGRLVAGVGHLAGAAIAWRQVEPLFRAGGRDDSERGLAAVAPAGKPTTVLEARDLVFGHRGRATPILRGCDLSIAPGERLLLQGASGSGKSTLAAVLAGLRSPDSGLLLAGGLDRPTLGGAGWRRRVVAVPQFHENHVLTETFAFNLLLGRGWPPRPEDLHEAEQVCRSLGLGDLLERMPAGLMQVVGETGWLLSHGERSRLFLARALLQGGDLLILDESFAALDPENLGRCLATVVERDCALLVVAHP